MEAAVLDKLKVYYNSPRYGVLWEKEKLISVDLEMHHLQVEPKEGVIDKWIDAGRMTDPHLAGKPYFDKVWNRYLETMELVGDETKISAVYNPHGLEDWIYKFGRDWLKIDSRMNLVMLFKKKDQMHRETENHVKQGHFEEFDLSSDQGIKAMEVYRNRMELLQIK